MIATVFIWSTRMFSRQQIEIALVNLQSGDQQANQTIFQWSENPQSIVQAIAIINETQINENKNNEILIYQACCVAEKNIVHNWMTYVLLDRRSIRNSLCERLINFNGSDVTRRKIISLVVAIALKDWPEDWPTCVQDFISSATNSPELCVLDFQIISELIVTIHETETITNFRRHQLIEEFNKSTVNLMKIIDWSLGNVAFRLICVSVIRLLKELCLTAPIESLYSHDMFSSLFNVFAVNEICANDALIAISNLLLNRPDAREVATKIFTETLQIIGSFCIPGCPENILLFIMHYMSTYGEDIDELCFEGEEMIDEVTELVHGIYRMILDNPPILEHNEDFWALWRTILQRYYRSSRSKNPFEALKPCFQLFQPLIPEIRASLFQGFNTAVEDGKLQSLNCQACWLFLSSVDKDGMIDYLGGQQPSSQLCIALGLVDACLSGREERDMVIKIFPKLFDFNQKSQNLEFGVSLLYTVSHSIRFMSREPSFLAAFGQCLMSFLNSPNISVRSSATTALLYISMRQPKLLYQGSHNANANGNNNVILDMISNNLNNWVSSIELKNAAKLIRSVALIASSQPTPELRLQRYEQVYNAVSMLLSSGDLNQINNGLKIVHSLTYLNLEECTPLYIQFFNQLIELLGQSVASGNELSTTEIIETITAAILKNDFEPVKGVLDSFVRVMLQLADFREPVLLSLANLRRKFVPMEEFYNMIYKAHIETILPGLATSQIEAYPVLHFFRYFNLRSESISILLEITVHFIRDERLDVAKEASKLLRSLLIRLCNEQNVNEIVNVRMHLLNATFTALTDTFHNAIFNSIAKTISALYESMNHSLYPSDQFNNDAAEVLKQKSNDKEFLVNFSKCLRSHVNDFPEFTAALREFLITIKCAAPSDKRLFKTEIKLDSLTEELMNLVSKEEKSAILAEELELLPALANLKIC